jgi:dolichol-phosphate mannosyltransferase
MVNDVSIERSLKIAVTIPCFRVGEKVLDVIERIGPEVHAIYIVDDCCPNQVGRLVESACSDPRVKVLYNRVNLGVGGATIVGMRQASADGCEILVKIDGDGQMDPGMIKTFCSVVQSGHADMSKGNRFFDIEGLQSMPKVRLLGNAFLSFLAKLSSGYWNIFDPTNGFICIHAAVFNVLPHGKISKRYFFESDLLFRLNVVGAVVVDVPMFAFYDEEESNMSPLKEVFPFLSSHLQNFGKRIFYSYFLRDFSVGSLELLLGLVLLIFGVIFGVANWGGAEPATAGTVMTAALPVIVGTQMLLAFLNYDIRRVPTVALQLRLGSIGAILVALRHKGWSEMPDRADISAVMRKENEN